MQRYLLFTIPQILVIKFPLPFFKKEDYYCHLKKRQYKSIILNSSDEYEIIEAINGLNCQKTLDVSTYQLN